MEILVNLQEKPVQYVQKQVQKILSTNTSIAIVTVLKIFLPYQQLNLILLLTCLPHLIHLLRDLKLIQVNHMI